MGDILGRGAYGYVTVNLYKPTNLRFAIKHIRLQDDPNVSILIGCYHVNDKFLGKKSNVERFGSEPTSPRMSLYCDIYGSALPRRRSSDLHGIDGNFTSSVLYRCS